MIEIAAWRWQVEWVGSPTELQQLLNKFAPGYVLHDLKIDKTDDGKDGYLVITRRPREKGPV